MGLSLFQWCRAVIRFLIKSLKVGAKMPLKVLRVANGHSTTTPEVRYMNCATKLVLAIIADNDNISYLEHHKPEAKEQPRQRRVAADFYDEPKVFTKDDDK